jgi:dihydroflavonol-4-reductase
MQGVRYLQHVASPFVTDMPDDRMELITPAVEGTRRAVGAAFAAGVERVVLTSSMAAVMYGHDKTRTAPFVASDWTNLDGRDVNAYVESKTRAEKEAWAIAERLGRARDLTVINPSAILGPLLDEDPGTSVALVQRLLNGSVPMAPQMWFAISDMRDVAALHVKAMTSPEAGGRRFPTAGPTHSFMQLAQMLRQDFPQSAAKLPRFEAPNWVMRIYGLFDRDVRGNLGELGVIKRSDSLDAKALLGRPFIPPHEAVRATARSLVEQKLV